MKLKTVWISYWSFWPKWNFKPARDFHRIYLKRNKRRLVGYCAQCAYAFETSCGYGFHIGHFDINEISFRVIKYHVNTIQNKMHTHIYQNIGSFWNIAEMKRHVNRTCFYTGLISQIGMSYFVSHVNVLLIFWSLLLNILPFFILFLPSHFVGRAR